MRSVTQLVLDAVALERETGRSGVAPDFTLDDLVTRVWDSHWKALQARGITREDLGAVAGGVWSWAEACGWPSVFQLVDSVEVVNHPEPRKISMPGWPAPFASPRAGTVELPSGPWAWIAPQRGDFIHVCFQHLHRPGDSMEAAIRMEEFSATAIDAIARQPSIRWWRDSGTGVTWEVRPELRLIPQESRGISFSHAGMESRSASVPDGAHLGELTDEQLHALFMQTEALIPDFSDRREPRSASA